MPGCAASPALKHPWILSGSTSLSSKGQILQEHTQNIPSRGQSPFPPGISALSTSAPQERAAGGSIPGSSSTSPSFPRGFRAGSSQAFSQSFPVLRAWRNPAPAQFLLSTPGRNNPPTRAMGKNVWGGRWKYPGMGNWRPGAPTPVPNSVQSARPSSPTAAPPVPATAWSDSSGTGGRRWILQALSRPGTTISRHGIGSSRETSHWERNFPTSGERQGLDFPFLNHPGPNRASVSRLFPPAASGRMEFRGDNFVFLMKRPRTGQSSVSRICPCPSPPWPGGSKPLREPQIPGLAANKALDGVQGGREGARPHRPIPGGAAGAALCPYKARLGSPGPIRARMGTPEPGPAQVSWTRPGERS